MNRFLTLVFALMAMLQFDSLQADSIENRRGPVQALAISHDGKTIAANDGARVFLTNAQDGRVLRTLSGRGGPISSVAVSPDGTLVSIAAASVVELRDATTGALLHLFTKPSGTFASVAFSPNGRILAAGGVSKLHEDQPGQPGADGTTVYETVGDVRMWEVRSLRLLRVLRGEANQRRFTHLSTLAFLPDGSTLAVGGTYLGQTGKALIGGGVELWEPRTGETQQVFVSPLNPITSLVFSPDGSTLAASGASQSKENAPDVAVWDVGEAKLLRAWRAGRSTDASSPAFSRDGSTLATVGEDGRVREWSVASGKKRRELNAPETIATAVTYSPDGTQLLIGHNDGSVHAYAEQAAPPILIREAGAPVSALLFTPDGKGLLAAGNNGSLQRLEAGTGRVQWSRPLRSEIIGLAFSPDDKILVGATASGQVDLWNLETMQHLDVLDAGNPLQSMALANVGGKLLVAMTRPQEKDGARTDEIKLWDVFAGTEVMQLPALHERISSLAFSPDGSTLLTAGENGTLALWDVATRRRRWKTDWPTGAVDAVFSADGRYFAAARWNGVEWREARDGRLIRLFAWPDVKLDEQGRSNGGVHSTTVSADGKLVAGYGSRAGADGAALYELRLWDTQTGNVLTTSVLQQAHGQVRFSRDHRQFLIGGADGVLQMLQIFPGEKSAVLWPLWRTGGAYRGLGRD